MKSRAKAGFRVRKYRAYLKVGNDCVLISYSVPHGKLHGYRITTSVVNGADTMCIVYDIESDTSTK